MYQVYLLALITFYTRRVIIKVGKKLRGAPHQQSDRRCLESRRLLSNTARPKLTWHWKLGTRSISMSERQKPTRRKSIQRLGGGRMCGLIFLEQNLWLYQAAWLLLLHGNRVCLFSEPLSRIIVFRVRLARPQHVIRLHWLVSTPSTAQLTPVKTKTPSLLITDSVQIPANTIVTTASITALDTITRVSGNVAVKG